MFRKAMITVLQSKVTTPFCLWISTGRMVGHQVQKTRNRKNRTLSTILSCCTAFFELFFNLPWKGGGAENDFLGQTLWRTVTLIIVHTAASGPIKFTQLRGEELWNGKSHINLLYSFIPSCICSASSSVLAYFWSNVVAWSVALQDHVFECFFKKLYIYWQQVMMRLVLLWRNDCVCLWKTHTGCKQPV